ncbi:MAG: GAF domain-containing sensor histidine kinase [Candidatus Methanofastidiosia archaeon]
MKNYQNVLLKILEISEQMRANLELEKLLDKICLAINEDLGWQNAIIVLWDKKTKTSKPMAARGMSEKLRKKILNSPPSPWTQWYKIPEFRVSHSFYVRELSRKKDIIPKEIQDKLAFGDNITNDKTKWQGDDFLMIPIRAKKEWLGIINVDNPLDGLAPKIDDIKFLELFANQVAIAIQNAKTFEKQKDFTKRLAIEVERKTKILEEQNLELQAYISSLTHDLKTPLVSIEALTTILREEFGYELSAESREFIERLSTNAKNMSLVLSDLVSYSNIQQASSKREEIETLELLEEEFMKVQDMFPEKEIKFITKGNFPKIYHSKLAFSLIFNNLLSNAMKFSKSDEGIVIEAGSEKEGHTYKFYVKDNGIGFDNKYSKKIFNLFERLEDKDTEGTGVGLATVKKMVEKLGGRIWAESEKGVGTTIFFIIPFE